MMKKLKLVVSDLHMGKGRVLPDGSINILEDFIADEVWEEFLVHFSSENYRDYEIELILNGDIFDNIQIDYLGVHSPIVTESIALVKFEKIIQGHPTFFKALKNFLDQGNKKLTYIIGNHDIDMVWKSCQKRFEEEIDFETNFVFERYVADGVHYEHGQQYEQVNHIEEEELFLSDGLKEPILNLPWGTHFVINFLIGLKKERPAVDKVRPISAFMRWSLVFDFWWFFKTLIRVFLYFFATRFSKSIYRTSHLKTTFKIIKDISQRPSLTLAARKLLEADESIHTVIMGHTHVPKYVQFPDGREYLNTGTWTEVTSLNLDTLGKHTRYTYVYVDYSSPKNRPYARLKEWKGRWHSDIDVYVG